MNDVSDIRPARSVLVLRGGRCVRAVFRGVLRARDEGETAGRDES